MQCNNRKIRSGVTLVESIIAIAIATICMLAVGALLASGHRSWQHTYDSAHKQIRQDAETVMITFSNMGRKSNRLGYTIYTINGSTFNPALPQTGDEEVVSGDAVEFRYWDVELDQYDSYGLLNVSKTATAYALFYLDGDILKVDYGPYPPGGIPDGGGGRNTSNITTNILAENVTTDPNIGAFSHTTIGGAGRGSVRVNITLTDPDDGETVRVTTATLIRNIWPR